MKTSHNRASYLPVLWLALFAALVTAALMSLLVGGGLLLGRLNPSHYQLVYITQAEEVYDNRVTMYVHDLRANIRHAVLRDYLGWGSDVAWSPEGRYIAFSRFQAGVVRRDIFLLDLYTGAQTRISEREPPKDYNSPSWPPDGRQLVYHGADFSTGSIDLYIFDLDTGQQQQLDSGDGQDSQPVWSPDGRTILFQREDPDSRWSNLHQIDLETGAVTPLHYQMMTGVSPAWSPDGRSLVFASWRESVRQFRLLVADARTGSTKQLVIRIPADYYPDISYLEPAWSPDGRGIAFVAFDLNSTSTLR